MNRKDPSHFPVLLGEVISLLDPGSGDIIVDATFGGGGHAAAIMERIAPDGRIIAFDRDPEAIDRASKGFYKDITCVNGDFRHVRNTVLEMGVEEVDGAVFDLGMSSYQVDDAERGFSFLRDGPLDMRFCGETGITAAEVVNTYSREELADIISEYGEERHARAVAGAIVRSRADSSIKTTGELAGIIKRAIGYRYTRQKLHPACRTFQALRIHVNDELGALEEGVNGAISLLRPGARICVIAFHSIEDRAVKNIFRDLGKMKKISILTKKPLRPSEKEIISNPRSRSARLRAAEKIR